MRAFTADALRELFVALSGRMLLERDELCRLDGLIGDADHGIAMALGMAGACAGQAALPSDANLTDLFNAAAKGFLNAVGASSGPLYGTAFMRAGVVAGRRMAMPASETPALLSAMAAGIAHRGKAPVGQKTMIDAWAPAATAADRLSQTGALTAAGLADIVAAARSGADATADMVATLGRSARLGVRSLGHRDPGAVSAAIIIEVICSALVPLIERDE